MVDLDKTHGPVGQFHPKDEKEPLFYLYNEEPIMGTCFRTGKTIPYEHLIVVDDKLMPAKVKETVAYVMTKRYPDGGSVTEKWRIRNHRRISLWAKKHVAFVLKKSYKEI